MGCIYSITNKLNGKMYIGQTMNFKKRKKDHICSAREGKIKTHLYISMREYGIDNFKFEIIEDNIDNDKLNERETYYIKKYDTYHKGYNMTYGGENITKNNPKVKEKISKIIKKQWEDGFYDYRKTNIQKAMEVAHKNASKRTKEMWKNEELKKRISKKIGEKLSKPIIAYNENEEILFTSYTKAVEYLKDKGYKAYKEEICRFKNKDKKKYDYYWKSPETIERVMNQVE